MKLRAGKMRCDFYVYVHKRIGSGEPFYVGKGCGRRAHKTNSRNPHWKNIVAKDGGYSTSYFAKDIDEEFALLVEIEAIDVLRRRGVKLVNMTDGGDGVSGLRCTEERKKILAETMKGNKYGIGHRHSEESKKKIAIAGMGRPSWNKGKKLTDAQLVNVRNRVQPPWSEERRKNYVKHELSKEARARIAEANRRRKGRTLSAEAKEKISVGNKGLKRSEESRLKMVEAWKRRKQCALEK